MSEDRTIILKMLEEKKITVEEAEKLLSASKKTVKTKRESNFSMRNLDGFINSLGNKAVKLKDKAVPIIGDVFETVKEKSSDCIDAISSSLNNEKNGVSHNEPKTYKEFDFNIEKGYNICFKAKKGEIHLKGYNGTKISGKIYFKSRNSSEEIDIIQGIDKIYTKYDDENFNSVFIDAILPYEYFDKIELFNYKGNIIAENLKCKNFRAENESGESVIKNVFAESGFIENNNSGVKFDFSDLNKFPSQNWEIEVNNGGCEVSVCEKKNAYITASSVLGNVKFDTDIYKTVSGEGNNIKIKRKKENPDFSSLKLNISVSNDDIIIK